MRERERKDNKKLSERGREESEGREMRCDEKGGGFSKKIGRNR